MRARRRRALDVGIVVLVLGVLLFAPLAALVAERLPVVVDARPTLQLAEAPEGSARAQRVQDLPVGLDASLEVVRPADVLPLAQAALGETGAAELLTLLEQTDHAERLAESAVVEGEEAVYPYSYPAMARVLDAAPSGGRTPEGAALGAALVRLSAQTGPRSVLNAGAAGYAVLDRAREAGICGAQLDLLLLVAATVEPVDEVVRQEADRAATVCPGDPTAGWVSGQYFSQRADDWLPGTPEREEAQAEADAAFRDLLDTHPDDPVALGGWADNRLRVALRSVETQPFTARYGFGQALAGFQRAEQTDGHRGAYLPGQAWALVGLGEPEAAADLMDGALEVPHPGVRMQMLLRAQEGAKDFAAAVGTAQRLHEVGLDAFRADGPLLPVPEAGDVLLAGLGTDRYRPLSGLTIKPAGGMGGGGAVHDASFLPVYRPDPRLTDLDVDCPDWSWRRDAVLAGDPEAALEGLPAERLTPIGPGTACPDVATLEAVARAEMEETQQLTVAQFGEVADARQNLWRWAGDLDRAARVVEEWVDLAPVSPEPVRRLGEVRYLQGEFDESAALFDVAARRLRERQFVDDIVVSEIQLQRSGALLAAGRTEEARTQLAALDERTSLWAVYDRDQGSWDLADRSALVAYHARALLADSRREAGEHTAAAEHYAAARELVPWLEDADVHRFVPARVDNNHAITLAALGRGAEAVESARLAVAADPRSPVFHLTAGVAATRAGDGELALASYREALASDPGTFPAANDLGVLLAREGREGEAVAALRRAVAAPDYALGWFNLGAVQAQRGPWHLLSAQGARAKAARLDPALADREPTPTLDETTYRTGLDLSRPLPPRWSVAQLQQVSPATSVGLLAVAALGVGLVRSTGRGRGSDLASDLLEPVEAWVGRHPLAARLRRPVVGVVVTVAALTLPALRDPLVSATEVVAAAVGVLAIALAGVRMRTVQARRRRVPVTQESWLPGLALGAATAPFGVPWAPLPVARTPVTPHPPPEAGEEASPTDPAAARAAARVHAAAPLTLGALALVLFVQTAWLGVPLTRTWAVAALIMAASTMVPVKPLDGAWLGKLGGLGVLSVLAAAVLLLVGVV